MHLVDSWLVYKAHLQLTVGLTDVSKKKHVYSILAKEMLKKRRERTSSTHKTQKTQHTKQKNKKAGPLGAQP